MKRIIVACDTLEIGGAETFAMRMARYYRERGHQVWLASVLGDRINQRLIEANAGDVPVISFLPGKVLNWLLYKADGLLYRLGRFSGLRRKLTVRKFRRFILDNQVEVVHTNMFAAFDTFNFAVRDIPGVCSVHSVHGDIIDHAYQQVSGRVYSRLHSYQSREILPTALSRVNHVVCTAEMHLEIFKAWNRFDVSKLSKIYNPVELSSDESRIDRAALGIADDAFVFGSMARCVKPKGWGELLEAFVQADVPGSVLVLIGDGPYLPELKARFGDRPDIHFLGAQPAPWKFLRLFDVAVSPSWFWESLPTAIIDYLSLGKPVIVTDNAECRFMIEGPGGSAGIVVPLEKDRWEVIQGDHPLRVDDLAAALRAMYDQPARREAAEANTAGCYAKFNKDRILAQYEALFAGQDVAPAVRNFETAL